MAATTKNLWQRITAIMADMGAVGKGGKTSYGERYAYHRIDDIDDQLRGALVAHGVTATLVEIADRKIDHFDGVDKQGKPRTTWYAECCIEIELVNADNPAEKASIKGWGQGLDYDDKATGKAISYAAKAAYLAAFHLRGQPDNEGDDIRRGKQQVQPAQRPAQTPQQPAQPPPEPQPVADTANLAETTDGAAAIEAVGGCTTAGAVANIMKGKLAKELAAECPTDHELMRKYGAECYRYLKHREAQ